MLHLPRILGLEFWIIDSSCYPCQFSNGAAGEFHAADIGGGLGDGDDEVGVHVDSSADAGEVVHHSFYPLVSFLITSFLSEPGYFCTHTGIGLASAISTKNPFNAFIPSAINGPA